MFLSFPQAKHAEMFPTLVLADVCRMRQRSQSELKDECQMTVKGEGLVILKNSSQIH